MKGERKSFYLGQRVLGMTPRQVIETIGTADIESAKLIISRLKPTKHT